MAERSRTRSSRTDDEPRFTRDTFVVGLVVVILIAAAAAFGFGKLSAKPSPGKLVYASNRGVFERTLATGKVRRIASLPSDTFEALPSPDGHWISYANLNGALWMLDLTGHRRWQLSDRDGYPQRWSTDDRLIVRDKGRFVVVDPNAGNQRFPVGGNPPVWLDTDRFVIGGPNPTDQTTFVHTAALKVVTAGNAGLPLTVAPDGKHVLFTQGGHVVVGKASSDDVTEFKTVFDGQAWTAATSPDGLVAFAGWDASRAVGVWVVEGPLRSHKVLGDKVDALAWSRAGHALIYQINGELWSLAVPGGRPKQLSRSGERVYLSSFAVV